MGDLSTHFSRAEFACRDNCGFDKPHAALVAGLQHLRDRLGVPVRVLSGCRCAARNAAVGGARNSQHLTGAAADIAVAGMDARALYAQARQVPQLRGFGVDDTRGYVHVDVRDGAARWCYDAGGRVIPWHEI